MAFHLASPPGSTFLAALALCMTAIYSLSRMLYNVFFHPLHNYPGPKLFAATRMAFLYYSYRGELPFRVKELHDKYGPVVRIAPDELAYTSTAAWRDIYGHRQGRPQIPKDEQAYPPADPKLPHSIFLVDDAEHARQRRQLSHAFSAKALEEQQPLIDSYVDLLIGQLHAKASAGPQDMVAWYNWTTFDIIGDLSFGESFNGLKNAAWHPWVGRIMGAFKTISIINALHRYGLIQFVPLVAPKQLLQMREDHINFTIEQVGKRLDQGTDRPDFISCMLKDSGYDKQPAMSLPQIHANASMLVVAGSETTATLLSGATYHLLRNPPAMEKLVREIRSAFTDESEINLQNIPRLQYMLACLDEALRIYHPLPFGLPRRTLPEGDIIAGQWVPGDTAVSVFAYACYRSAANFSQPDTFIPERWLDNNPEFASDQNDAFNPFSMGARNCIGRNLAYVEMRLILARLLWNFDLQLAHPAVDWASHPAHVLWDKPPLMVHLTPVNRGGGN